ncbi:GntR family transcriptional regulator [Hamadaea flava]|uniref:GntR family transcriptional regulator n=1 Tax=Hamadaea flava TaxID=1742688 RepID=A0ABV8LUZ3_9ACTN|nr:GntR family transcriptional regulator [Hamadaea flava]MCP2329490.1 GntR family transcriptional regulator [Hamadaea flava]
MSTVTTIATAHGPAATDSLADLVVLDKASPVPLYFQVAQQLEAAVEGGKLPPGTRLDNEIELADQLGVSRPTMRRAMEFLVDKGLIVRRRGVGTRVVQSRVRRPLELTSLYDDLKNAGQEPTTTVLSNTIEPATAAVAEALGLAEGTPVAVVVRLRSARNQPLARMCNYLPAALLEISTEALESQGLYQLIRAAGVRLHAATQVIGARNATAAEARLLEESRGAAVLTMERVAYDDHGTPVEYGTHIYAATRYSFQLSLLTG